MKVGNISNFKRTSGGVGTLRHMKLVGFVCLLREICELLSIASTLQSIIIFIAHHVQDGYIEKEKYMYDH